MLVITKRRCLLCGKLFSPSTKKHLFCEKKCYRRYYFETVERKFPKFICPHCEFKTNLNFNIKLKSNRKKWENFKCPNCGKNNLERKKLQFIYINATKVNVV